jgi:uncharacterized phage protein (TIGR01671 family)
MREILFRGKRLDKDKWVEGYYTAFNPDIGNDIPVIENRVNDYVVSLDTVGQYTGLKDRNGKKIFEGDIVEGHCHSAWRHDLQRCEVAYGRDGFEARHYVNCGDELRYFTYRVLFSKDVVVIGNIHDNPELLEGGEQK